jgi:uncharacterized membrane protein YdbT with pleckstrin-like domain
MEKNSMDGYLNKLLGENEKTILITNQHWFVIIRSIAFELLLIIVTIIAVTMVMIYWLPQPIAYTGYLLLLIPLSSLVRDVLIWYSHKYVVTSHRVIQIFGLFNKNVTDSSLEKVNDVKMEQSFFGRLFNFGDIEILTASELGINRFTFIGNPVGFKTAMINAKHTLDKGEKPSTAQAVMDVPRLLKELDELCRQRVITPEEFAEKKTKLLNLI